MRPWLIRAAVLAVLHAAADTLIAYYRLGEPTSLSLQRGIALGVLVGAAALWGALDGLRRKLDRGRTWVLAAIFGGLLAAILGLVAKAILLNQTSGEDVWPAITGGAAFTALLILIPAGVGLGVGGAMKSPREVVEVDDAEDADTEDDLADEEPGEMPSPRPRKPRPEPDGRHRKDKVIPPG